MYKHVITQRSLPSDLQTQETKTSILWACLSQMYKKCIANRCQHLSVFDNYLTLETVYKELRSTMAMEGMDCRIRISEFGNCFLEFSIYIRIFKLKLKLSDYTVKLENLYIRNVHRKKINIQLIAVNHLERDILQILV